MNRIEELILNGNFMISPWRIALPVIIYCFLVQNVEKVTLVFLGNAALIISYDFISRVS